MRDEEGNVYLIIIKGNSFRLSVHSDLTEPAVANMIVNIWNISQKQPIVSPQLLVNHTSPNHTYFNFLNFRNVFDH